MMAKTLQLLMLIVLLCHVEISSQSQAAAAEWGSWSDWSACDCTPGAVRMRSRECFQPPCQRVHNDECTGLSIARADCHACPPDELPTLLVSNSQPDDPEFILAPNGEVVGGLDLNHHVAQVVSDGPNVIYIGSHSVHHYDLNTGAETELYSASGADGFYGIALDKNAQKVFAWKMLTGIISFQYNGGIAETVLSDDIQNYAMVMAVDDINKDIFYVMHPNRNPIMKVNYETASTPVEITTTSSSPIGFALESNTGVLYIVSQQGDLYTVNTNDVETPLIAPTIILSGLGSNVISFLLVNDNIFYTEMMSGQVWRISKTAESSDEKISHMARRENGILLQMCIYPDVSTWRTWGEWSTCDGDCIHGAMKMRSRECLQLSDNQVVDAARCPGQSTENMDCAAELTCPPVTASLGPWGNWNTCIGSCISGAERTRSRECFDVSCLLVDDEHCTGTNSESRDCRAEMGCPPASTWNCPKLWRNCYGNGRCLPYYYGGKQIKSLATCQCNAGFTGVWCDIYTNGSSWLWPWMDKWRATPRRHPLV